jgi:signal transduction histidine kinase
MTARYKKSLDTLVFVTFFLIFSGVFLIGLTSLFLTQNMMSKTRAIAEESHNIDFINSLYNKTYTLITAIHHQTIHGDETYSRQTHELALEIDRDLEEYIKHEEDASYPESDEEMRQLIGLRCGLQDLHQKVLAIQKPEGVDPLTHWNEVLSQHASKIQGQVQRINELHFGIIGRKLEKAHARMSMIFYLYLSCALAGLALLFMGYRLHSRHVVRPIKQLAKLTEQVAGGDLSVRASSDSQTEIGVLFKAFNSMTDQLNSHEKELLGFNRELEQKVQERTRALEQSCKSLQETQAELSHLEKMAMLGQIAASVNHEVRTPLNALSMNVQLIRKTLEDRNAGISNERRTQQREILERIAIVDQEVLRISDMLEEFVRYARFAPLQMAEIDLNKVVEHVANMLSERAEQAQVSMHLSLPDAVSELMADKDKLVQAMVNLCINAIHAMPEGGMLTLATAVQGDMVEISVADTGTGIPEEDLDKIFQPFFTSKATGLGFGLPTVQRIVEEHGGQITCQSRVGEGTVFRIQLPLIHTSQGSRE